MNSTALTKPQEDRGNCTLNQGLRDAMVSCVVLLLVSGLLNIRLFFLNRRYKRDLYSRIISPTPAELLDSTSPRLPTLPTSPISPISLGRRRCTLPEGEVEHRKDSYIPTDSRHYEVIHPYSDSSRPSIGAVVARHAMGELKEADEGPSSGTIVTVDTIVAAMNTVTLSQFDTRKLRRDEPTAFSFTRRQSETNRNKPKETESLAISEADRQLLNGGNVDLNFNVFDEQQKHFLSQAMFIQPIGVSFVSPGNERVTHCCGGDGQDVPVKNVPVRVEEVSSGYQNIKRYRFSAPPTLDHVSSPPAFDHTSAPQALSKIELAMEDKPKRPRSLPLEVCEEYARDSSLIETDRKKGQSCEDILCDDRSDGGGGSNGMFTSEDGYAYVYEESVAIRTD